MTTRTQTGAGTAAGFTLIETVFALTILMIVAAGVMPLPTDQLTILTATNVAGTFAGLPNGARVLTNLGGSFQVTYASNNVRLSNFLAPIPADFDHNGVVDAADLGVWSTAIAGETAAGDANGDGQTDGNDFLVWHLPAEESFSNVRSTANRIETVCIANAARAKERKH